MTKFEGLDTPKGLGELNTHLADRSYIDGYTPSTSDVETFKSVGTAPDAKFPHARRWYNHIAFHSETERSSWGAPTAAAATTSAAGAKKDDDFDLFEDDADADAAWEAEIQKRADEQAAKKKAEMAAKGKTADKLKSAVVIDVKPWEDTTDLVEMEKLVRAIEMPGLEWKASKLVPIGYGIKKLQISCHIVDEDVSVDDIQEKIAEFADHVQSTDIITFTKL
eukprot:TRINITY_DN137_c0_g1_i1.p1 TRINITY_DN137_c0_g1~~TRINITY_DN137_c0_g1_i1.p1  ORF type:complete len:255 (+),score=64.34 TRINITY_DN137_c0_g1_i1:101-766(+)